MKRPFQPLFSFLIAVIALVPRDALATGDFYEYPMQTLADYLRRDPLPAKSIAQILDETVKEAPEPEQKLAKINYAQELFALSKKSGPDALASIEKMIATARAESATPLLNLLNDVRDLYTGPAAVGETESYLEWRIANADRFGVEFDAAKPADPAKERKGPNLELLADIERQLAKASPALKPHWLYVRGAAEYLAGRIGESQSWFLKVSADFPKSPRAESALFMTARCQMWRSRSPEYTQQEMKLVDRERPKVKKLFDEYFAKYPKGRLLGDALGWYGAYAYDGHDFGTALRCYAQQLELPDHPELRPAAMDMVEKTLSHLASEPRDGAFAEVAKHPGAAQALVYLIINTSESDNYNGKIDSIDEVRGWRKAVLPRVAAALAAEAKLYQNAGWKPRYLAMLAYAASGAGHHEQALELLETAESTAKESDDLLLARGVALHRAKRPGEAVAALQILLGKFPKSPLVKGARLRLALALTDNHQAGEAVLALGKLLEKPGKPEKKADADKMPEESAPANAEDEFRSDDGQSPILYGIDFDQVRALIDALLNFAPVGELAATSQKPGLDPVLRLRFTEPIAARLLAKEQFDEAKKFMTPAQWSLLAGPIEALTISAKAAKEPAAHAAACLKLADAWAAARGKLLTYPLDSEETRRAVFIAFSADANTRRADSAPFIGATGNFKIDIESRDELRHAFNWWLEASDAQPGTRLTAQALWHALKAMPRIADVSRFTFERAIARNWTDTARKLHDRLRKECADSVEARRCAVAWDFTASKKETPPGELDFTHRDAANAGIPAMEAFGIEERYRDDADADAEAIFRELKNIEQDAGKADVATLKARAVALQERVRGTFASLYDARWVNFVEDLALFFSEPDPGPQVRQRYVQLRAKFLRESAIGGGGYAEAGTDAPEPDEILRKEIENALADARTKPVSDYFEFLELAVIANHFVFVETAPKGRKEEPDEKGDADTYRTHDYPLLAKAAHAYLEKYPKSKKREAALLLHARAVYRSSEEIALRKLVTWPQADRWEGGYVTAFTQREPFDAKRVLATLDEYDHAFPKGRYAADIRNYRAAVALRMHDWKIALDLTVSQLDDPTCVGLHADAARRLGELFTQLTDERFRADLLPVIRAGKRGRELLGKFAAYESDTNPLLYMRAWLRGQLAGK